MKTILLLTTIIFTAAARADEQVISTFSWKELADAGKLTAARSSAHRITRSKSRTAAQGR